jgi:hypothetical protein
MNRFLKCVLVASGLCVASNARAAVLDRADASGLKFFFRDVPPGHAFELNTGGCHPSNDADTTVYLLERTSTANVFITRAVGETSIGGDVDSDSFTSQCGSISTGYNTSSRTKRFVVVVWGHAPNTEIVSFERLMRAAPESPVPGSPTFPTIVTEGTSRGVVGGARLQLENWSAIGPRCRSVLMAKPERPTITDSMKDPLMFAINRTIGSRSYFDDDNGTGPFPAIVPDQDCNGVCDVLVGPLEPHLDHGTATIWDNRVAFPGALTGCLDEDGVAPDIEAFYNTNPTDADSDDDGLNDFVELVGLSRGVGEIRNPRSFILPGNEDAELMPLNDADPIVQDVFFEIDYMEGDLAAQDTEPHRPYPELLNDLNVVFGDTGHTNRGQIRVHVAPFGDLPQNSQMIGHRMGLDFHRCILAQPSAKNDRITLSSLKNNRGLFRPIRNAIFHYVVVGHNRYKGDVGCNLDGSSGVASLPGNNVVVAMGSAPDRADRQRGTHIHEYGHNFNLTHYGNDGKRNRQSQVHSSVMNYRYQMPGWGEQAPMFRGWSYSRGQCDARPDLCNIPLFGSCVKYGEFSTKCNKPINVSSAITCDCDREEWSRVKVRSNSYLSGTIGFGEQGAGFDDERELNFLAGVSTVVPPWFAAEAAARKESLLADGYVEGVDFVVDENGVTVAPESSSAVLPDETSGDICGLLSIPSDVNVKDHECKPRD